MKDAVCILSTRVNSCYTTCMNEHEQKIEKLKEYFEKRDDVVMAYLFGSQANGATHTDSDWDIAVYFKSETELVEWEKQDREYPEEDRVWGDCIKILETDNVDFIVLNRAPASIADTAIRGMPLAMKDHGLWLEFMLRVTSAAVDFRRTAREFADVYWRSASLTEKDAYALERRLIFVDGELKALPEFSNLDWAMYQQNAHKRREVERLIENVMNALIDCAKIMLASEKQSVPQSYREIISNACALLHFSEADGVRLASWVILRNILAHEYLDLRWRDVSGFLKDGEAYVGKFITGARSFLEENRT